MPPLTPSVQARVVVDDSHDGPLALEVLAGRDGLDRHITSPYIQKTDLALAGQRYDCLALDEARFDVLDVAVPFVRVPVAPGRNLAILVEVAVRAQLLRAAGHCAPERLSADRDRRLQAAALSVRPLEFSEDR